MTYRSYVGAPLTGYTNGFSSYPQTFQMLDIAALQHLYGANFTHNSGDSVYTFSPSTSEMFVNGVGQGAPFANKLFVTIWDGGGEDTYDFSNFSDDLTIDLGPGGWSAIEDEDQVTPNNSQRATLGFPGSSVIFARANVFNALQYQGDDRSLIENAIGGSGDDVITGNAADNRLEGGAGNDSLDGEGGDDTAVFMLGAGADVTLTNVAMTNSANGETDSLASIENVEFVAAADVTARSLVASSFSGVVNYTGGSGGDSVFAGAGPTFLLAATATTCFWAQPAAIVWKAVSAPTRSPAATAPTFWSAGRARTTCAACPASTISRATPATTRCAAGRARM